MKRSLIALAVLLALAGTGYGVAYRFFPLEASAFSARLELLTDGVKRVESGGLLGYSKNSCADGQPCTCVALVHGMGDDALGWKRLLSLPEKDWDGPVRLVALSLPGVGGSRAPESPDGYRVVRQAHALQRALEPLCPKWTVIGNSLGGWISAWLAIQWPEGVQRLVLLGSAGLKSASLSSAGSQLNEVTVESLKEFQRKAYYKPRELPEYVWEAAVRRVRKNRASDVARAQTPEDWLDDKLHRIQSPTLLVWGEADRISDIEVGQKYLEGVSNSRLVRLPKCGHVPQRECPADLMSKVREFLERPISAPNGGR